MITPVRPATTTPPGPGHSQADPHLVLLDINLPYFDGYHLCRQVRKGVGCADHHRHQPGQPDRRADGHEPPGRTTLSPNPTTPQILLARIASLLRRSYAAATADRMVHRDVTLLVSQGRVSYQGRECELTRNELGILQLMMGQPGRIFSGTDHESPVAVGPVHRRQTP